jgi:hypothetical protein
MMSMVDKGLSYNHQNSIRILSTLNKAISYHSFLYVDS